MRPIEFIIKFVQLIERGSVALTDLMHHWSSNRPFPSGVVTRWEPDSTDATRSKTNPPSYGTSRTRTYSRKHNNKIWVGLQPSRTIKHARIISESISLETTARDLIKILSERFRVNADKWRLLVFSNDKAPYELDEDSKLEKFLSNKKERLYFYPK
jgi:hypothetical protein